jgi:septal ring factor EnvC (AmiA/AmiB activator)
MTQARSDIRQYEARIDDLKRQQKTAVGSQVDEITTNIKTVQDNIAGSKKTIDNGQDAVDSYQKMNEKLRKQL